MRPTTEDNMNSLAPQQYCLRWKYHHSNLQAMFSQLLERESYCDVTLACEGKTLRAHKVMLSACSTYFDTILSQHDENKAIVILKDVKFSDIQALVSFMYKGEINVENTELSSLLKTAEELKIKGLAEVSWRSDQEQQNQSFNVTADESNISKKRKLDSTLATTANIKKEFTDKHQENDDMDGADVEDESEPDQSIWEPEMQHVVDTDNVELPKPTTGTVNVTTFPSEEERASSVTNVSQGFSEQPAHVPDLSQFSDVMKMNDYLESGGRRPQFWEEPFTKRLMEAIKNKELEMKVAAELMGVSYGTLYGRYRDAYGCLKHPYRVRDFWLEQGPARIPTCVEHAIYCYFFNRVEKCLVVAGVNILRVYRLVPTDTTCQPPKTKFECLAQYTLFGNIMCLQSVTLCPSSPDALLLSFSEAKFSLVEYDRDTHSLRTLSLHYFEDDKFKNGHTQHWSPPLIRVDPDGRCVVGLVYGSYFVVLPFGRTIDDNAKGAQVMPSYTIPISTIDPKMNNIMDFDFLHGHTSTPLPLDMC